MMCDLTRDQRDLGGALLEKVVRKVACIFLLGFAMTAGTFGVAYASEPFLEEFNLKYGTGGTQLDDCITCHISSNPDGNHELNPYGDDFKDKGHDFEAIELMDSDDDGFSNKAEINAMTFPGDPDSVPAGDSGCFIATAFPFVSPPETLIRATLPSLVGRTDFVETALLILLPTVIGITLVLRRKRGSGF
jgi:hypothetical protein